MLTSCLLYSLAAHSLPIPQRVIRESAVFSRHRDKNLQIALGSSQYVPSPWPWLWSWQFLLPGSLLPSLLLPPECSVYKGLTGPGLCLLQDLSWLSTDKENSGRRFLLLVSLFVCSVCLAGHKRLAQSGPGLPLQLSHCPPPRLHFSQMTPHFTGLLPPHLQTLICSLNTRLGFSYPHSLPGSLLIVPTLSVLFLFYD